MKTIVAFALMFAGTSSAFAACPYTYKAITPYSKEGVSRAEKIEECAKDPKVIERATQRLYEEVVRQIRASAILTRVQQDAEIANIDMEELRAMEQHLWDYYAKHGTQPGLEEPKPPVENSPNAPGEVPPAENPPGADQPGEGQN